VSFEDRQDLLGHRSHMITTHYSAADLTRLIEAAESVMANGRSWWCCGLHFGRVPQPRRVDLNKTGQLFEIIGSGGPLLGATIEVREHLPAARFLAALAEHEMVDRGRRRMERHLAEAPCRPAKHSPRSTS
jgi:hypothetical protein